MKALRFRRAKHADLQAIVALLADDDLARERESTDWAAMPAYEAAFERIDAGPGGIFVGELDGRIVAIYQLAIVPVLSYGGTVGAHLHDVRVASDLRGQGLGAELVADAEERARGLGCQHLSLTSNNARTRAHRFYERNGYLKTRVGFRKPLE
ncbi:MAG: GNAT family N-acetyltransferase [Alphaproteobacteria bacterium]